MTLTKKKKQNDVDSIAHTQTHIHIDLAKRTGKPNEPRIITERKYFVNRDYISYIHAFY